MNRLFRLEKKLKKTRLNRKVDFIAHLPLTYSLDSLIAYELWFKLRIDKYLLSDDESRPAIMNPPEWWWRYPPPIKQELLMKSNWRLSKINLKRTFDSIDNWLAVVDEIFSQFSKQYWYEKKWSKLAINSITLPVCLVMCGWKRAD